MFQCCYPFGSGHVISKDVPSSHGEINSSPDTAPWMHGKLKTCVNVLQALELQHVGWICPCYLLGMSRCVISACE